MNQLPEWPTFDNEGYMDPPDSVLLNYQREMTEAAIARLRVAVRKLQAIKTLEVGFTSESGRTWPANDAQTSYWKSELATEALAAIGDLPSDEALEAVGVK